MGKEIPGCPFRGLLDITSVSLGKYLILQGYALLIVFLLSDLQLCRDKMAAQSNIVAWKIPWTGSLAVYSP